MGAHRAPYDLRGLSAGQTLCRHRVTHADRDRSDVVVSPERQFDVASGSATFRDTIPGLSVSVYTTYNRPHREAGVAAE